VNPRMKLSLKLSLV